MNRSDATNRKPKYRFLLGLGEPFQPNPWDISDSEDDEKDFLMASQMVEKELTQSKPLLPLNRTEMYEGNWDESPWEMNW